MSEPDAVPLPREGEVFFDVRGEARSMRLSWYANSKVAVFSIWQGNRCTGTFRLPFADLTRMVQALQAGPPEAVPAGPPGGSGYQDRDGYQDHDGYQDRDFGQDHDFPATASYGQPMPADTTAYLPGQEYADPGYQEPQYQEPQYREPDYQDPRYQEPQYQEPLPGTPAPGTPVPRASIPRASIPRVRVRRLERAGLRQQRSWCRPALWGPPLRPARLPRRISRRSWLRPGRAAQCFTR